jgi:hypothetical protein
MFRFMGKTRDLRIFSTVIFVVCFVIAIFYVYQLFIGFTAFILYYWYVSGPIFLGLYLFYYFLNTHRKIFRRSLLLDSLRYREAYELETRSNPIENAELTKSYRKWLIKKNNPPISYKLKHFFAKIEILGGILLLFVILSISLLLLYSYIFQLKAFNLGG